MNAAMGDGAVHFVSETCNFDLYKATFTRESASMPAGKGGFQTGGGPALF